MVMNEAEYIGQLETLFNENKDKRFKRYELIYNFGNNDYKYAFGTKDNAGNFYGIPVCAGNVMKYSVKSGETFILQGVKGKNYEYTGGIYDEKRNCIWGVPRNSNYLLKIDISSDLIEEIPLDINFEAEGINGSHHYSGVLNNGYIYCPPRRGDGGILKISVDTFETSVIPIEQPEGSGRLYSGSVLHPNGNIYFMPSAGSCVMVMNTATEEVSFIGEPKEYMNFGGVIWKDGNIYSIVGYGIEKTDVHKNTSELVYKFQAPKRSYGTTLHANGRIYSTFIDSTGEIIEYDPAEKKAAIAAVFNELHLASATAGVMMPDGNIYLTPCQGKYLARYVFG